MEKILVAMSGGVDSSVAAAILKKEYSPVGATLRLFTNEDALICDRTRTCCSVDDVEDARRVCEALSIPHYVFNFRDLFRETVIGRFISEYAAGRTPNPCIDCNRYIKFDRFLRRADELGIHKIATGHYARIVYNDETQRWELKKGVDPEKDQTYVLYGMTQLQLSRTVFPLGELDKDTVRRMASQLGLAVSGKPDSQDICFVPDGDYAAFLSKTMDSPPGPGTFTDTQGRVLGPHRGHTAYTVGQRRGLGISADERLYVLEKDAQKNRVVLGKNSELYRRSLIAGDCNWISVDGVSQPLFVRAKIRYSKNDEDAVVTDMGEGFVRVELAKPQRAPAPGQAVVFYHGDTVVGGGIITTTEE